MYFVLFSHVIVNVHFYQCIYIYLFTWIILLIYFQTCSKCKERRKCTKSFSIQKFPKVLVIHLKRFSPTERFRGKLSVIIDFPLNGLDLSPYAATTGHNDCQYNLYAISNHSGTTYSGHYTAYCKHPYSNQWHEYNDSR